MLTLLLAGHITVIFRDLAEALKRPFAIEKQVQAKVRA
jgi:hypothetical protein